MTDKQWAKFLDEVRCYLESLPPRGNKPEGKRPKRRHSAKRRSTRKATP